MREIYEIASCGMAYIHIQSIIKIGIVVHASGFASKFRGVVKFLLLLGWVYESRR
jgi:hypothetical protein